MNKTKITSIAMLGAITVLLPNVYADSFELLMTEGASDMDCVEKDICYTPSVLVITRGSDVIAVNNDIVPHTVSSGMPSGADDKFDTGMIGVNSQSTISGASLEKDGSYPYFCMLHPWMVGEIHIVKEMYDSNVDVSLPFFEQVRKWHDEGKISDSEFYWAVGYYDDRGYVN